MRDRAKHILKHELHWPDYQVDVGIRAGFRCEYCGKDLLESYENYDQWQVDHIIPNGNNALENLALSCKLCNFLKRHTIPTVSAGNTDRESLINAAKAIISERRRVKEKIFLRTLEVIKSLR